MGNPFPQSRKREAAWQFASLHWLCFSSVGFVSSRGRPRKRRPTTGTTPSLSIFPTRGDRPEELAYSTRFPVRWDPDRRRLQLPFWQLGSFRTGTRNQIAPAKSNHIIHDTAGLLRPGGDRLNQNPQISYFRRSNVARPSGFLFRGPASDGRGGMESPCWRNAQGTHSTTESHKAQILSRLKLAVNFYPL